MQVRVLFFGVLKDLTGRSSDVLTLADQATAGDLVEHYEKRVNGLSGVLKSVAISVNQEYATPDAPLHNGDEVALLPPVSGGMDQRDAGGAGTKSMFVSIVREPINAALITSRIKQPQDGAVVVFEGIVRNHSRGRRTLFLEYEAYEAMALKELHSLVEKACAQFQIRDVALVHRLGRLEIGETSVLIVVASAHRTAAFEASRWLIDALKRTVPIWKKEYFADGAVWADGEPFPEQLTAGTLSRDPASN